MSVRRPSEDELKFINRKFVKGEQKLSQDDVWVMDVEGAKSGVQTAYFSFLSKKSIENFAKNVNAKSHNRNAKTVAYYLNHDTVSRLPMGALFDAEAVEDGDQLAFRHKVFLPAGYSTGDVTTDDYVRSVQLGMSEDVSVGFIANKFICDLCENDIRSTKCSHWPGMRYNVGTEDAPEYKVCTYTVDRARLVEESAAWKGALPGARILSEGAGNESGLPQQFNIKQFADGSYLRFSYSADGGIEQIDDFTAGQFLSDEYNGGSVMKKEFEMNEDLARELEAVAALVGEEELIEKPAEEPEVPDVPDSEELAMYPLQRQIASLQTRAAELEEAYADLQDEMETLRGQFEQAVGELAEAATTSERYVSEIDSDIHKLSVGIDAETYSREVVDSIVSKMDLDEKLNYRNNLRVKLAKALRTGRSTSNEEEKQPRTLANSTDPSVYRVGRK